jgi:hypothetical protein
MIGKRRRKDDGGSWKDFQKAVELVQEKKKAEGELNGVTIGS